MTIFEDNMVTVEKSEGNRSVKELDSRKDTEESEEGKLSAEQNSRQENEGHLPYAEKAEQKEKETKEEKKEEKNIDEKEKREGVDEKEEKKVKKHKKKHDTEENNDAEKMEIDEGKDIKDKKEKKEKKDKKGKKDKKDKKDKKEKSGKDDVEKLRKKLEKIDAKLQKILAKKEDYIQQIKCAEEKKKGDGVVAQLESLIIQSTDKEVHAEGDVGTQGAEEKTQGTVKCTESKPQDEQFSNIVHGKDFEDTETVGGHDRHKLGVSYADAVKTSDGHAPENISGLNLQTN